MSQNNEKQVALTQEQLERLDEIYDGVHELIALLMNISADELEWDMSLIGPLADNAIEYLRSKEHTVSYPGIVENEDGTQTYCDGTEKPELTAQEEAMDSNWVALMKKAEDNGFIAHSYGGTSILCTHVEQIKSLGMKDYLRKQRANGICPKDLGYEGCGLIANCSTCYIGRKKATEPEGK